MLEQFADVLRMTTSQANLRIPNMYAKRLTDLLIIVLCLTGTANAHAAEPLRTTIDREIQAGWVQEKLAAAERSSDSVFLRRAYLDLVGTIPTREETLAFLNNTDVKKREAVVDRLLADPRFARHQATVWDLALLGRNARNVNGTRARDGFRKWLAVQFEKNTRYDQFATKLLIAEEEGAQLFFVANRDTDEMTTASTRFFLGTQIQCAKCHDHPFEPWTQKDYYGMAGFYVRTFVTEVGKDNDKKYVVAERSTGDVFFTGTKDPKKPGAKGEPVKPKFLNGSELTEPAMAADFKEPKLTPGQVPPKPTFSRRTKIVEWITAKDNPYFARTAVNRVWAQFMGRGFVHPVDDFNSQNEPSHPKLLQAMTAEFVAQQFDLKWLIREIVLSEAYQVADTGLATDAMPKWYERARVRPLSAEELTAAFASATGHSVEAVQKNGVFENLVKYFGEPTDGQGAFQGSIAEHLFLNNSGDLRGLCQPKKGNFAEELVNSRESWEVRIENMFLTVLSRKPKATERQRFLKHFEQATNPKTTAQLVEEALWVLVSCSEFRFNR
jgi:hypothetical protein